jgi:hypothetical protein
MLDNKIDKNTKMTNALKAPTPEPTAAPQYEGRHRSDAKRSIGKMVLGWFRSGRHAQPKGMPQPVPTPEAHSVPSLMPEVRKTPSFELSYRRGDTKDERLQNKSVNLKDHAPLLDREEVAEQLGGHGFGELQAVISLPERQSWILEEQKDKSIPLYCFKREDAMGEPEYLIMSRNQVDQVHRMHTQGHPSWQDIAGGVLSMHPGDEQQIGRAAWLPDVGNNVEMLNHDRELAAHYESVSRSQAFISVGEQGVLRIQDDDSKDGTYVTMGPVIPSALNAPTDEYSIVG